ncbi:MAG: hypothetical protein JWP91_2555 [Fibrobacteres bacterium]|nr:hypothetical protein [Fibrobacterota bacterium]
MKPNWKLLAAAAVLAALWGCMKAGDGVGLDASGKTVPFCTAHPGDPSCVVAVDPCIANPSGPTCADPCLKNPLSQACSLSACLKNPAAPGCTVMDCAKTPTAPGCSVNVCLANPKAPGCSVDVCVANPAAAECQPKTRFSEVLPILKDQCEQCHSPGGAGYGQGKLNMTADSAFANLVGVLVAQQSVAPGWKRVNPGLPDSSMLIIKLTGGASPKLPNGKTYGAGMPLGKSSLPDVSIQTIRKWIADGALK